MVGETQLAETGSRSLPRNCWVLALSGAEKTHATPILRAIGQSATAKQRWNRQIGQFGTELTNSAFL